MVDMCRAKHRQGKHLPLFTDTEVNNCVNIYQTQHQIVPFFQKKK